MKVTKVKGIRKKMIDLIEQTRDSGEVIDYFTLTETEYNELREDAGCPLGQKMESFLGVAIVVEEPARVERKSFDH
jgi:hypothetical protein